LSGLVRDGLGDAEPGGGIYVHYPFCLHRCPFCDFTLITPRQIPHGGYTDALISELARRGPALDGPARTLYIGGGTPSLWALEELKRFIGAVRQHPGLTEGAEITIEANPSEVTPAWLDAIRAAGINRVSLGVQALRDDLLIPLERTHDTQMALAAVDLLLTSDLLSVSMDLIFGLEGQTLEAWNEDLRHAIQLGLPHLSVYALTVERGTPLWDRVRRGTVSLPDDDEQAEMMLLARHLLTEAGYGHYEVSSYARPGHRARHNSGYWSMRPYLGLGAGAHGFLPPLRYSNDPRVRRYMSRALTEVPTANEEHLSEEILAFEDLMCGLRDLEYGVALERVAPRFQGVVDEEISGGRLECSGGRVRLTEEGMRFMDDVLLRLTPET